MIPLSQPRPTPINIFAAAFLTAALVPFLDGITDLGLTETRLQVEYPYFPWDRDRVIIWLSSWLSIALIPLAMVWLIAAPFARWLVSGMTLLKTPAALASAATLLPAGTTGLVVGARVEVEGVVRGGVFVASKVKVVSDTDLQDRGFELIGSITAVNVAQSTITLRGVTVSTARSDLRIDNGTLANLVVGQAVEVKGGLAADRRTLEATRIKIVR